MNPAAILRLMRPKQWTKNLLVFAALIFTGGYRDQKQVIAVLLTFVAMCLVSSATYALNDVADDKRDRLHPKKKDRPVASGQVSVTGAVALAIVLLAAGLALAWWVQMAVLIGAAIYLGIQAIYNVGFKSLPVLDVFTLSSGFVLRAIIGAAAINVQVSVWLLLCTGALALLLGFAKRRSEFVLMGDERGQSRPALHGYSIRALDGLVLISGCCAAITFGMYVVESETAKKFPALILTAPIVLFGIYRYLFLVFSNDEGGEPENLVFGDPQMIGTLIAFLAAAFYAMGGAELPFVLRGN